MKILIHAPTAGALERARTEAALLTRHDPESAVRIVADGPGAAAALFMHPSGSRLTGSVPGAPPAVRQAGKAVSTVPRSRLPGLAARCPSGRRQLL